MKLKKVEKTTRPFRDDLNQIPYTYSGSHKYIEKIRFDRVYEELRREVQDIVQEVVIKIIPKKNKCKKTKWFLEEALQLSVNKRGAKGKEEKEKYTHLNA